MEKERGSELGKLSIFGVGAILLSKAFGDLGYVDIGSGWIKASGRIIEDIHWADLGRNGFNFCCY